VKQKCLYKVLLHKNSDILYFSATRNQCNGETEISSYKFYFIGSLISSLSLQQEISAMVKQKCLYKVLLHKNSDILYFSATRNQCNGETEISSYKFYFIGIRYLLFLCNKKSVQW
jgi:hypothetical protein